MSKWINTNDRYPDQKAIDRGNRGVQIFKESWDHLTDQRKNGADVGELNCLLSVYLVNRIIDLEEKMAELTDSKEHDDISAIKERS